MFLLFGEKGESFCWIWEKINTTNKIRTLTVFVKLSSHTAAAALISQWENILVSPTANWFSLAIHSNCILNSHLFSSWVKFCWSVRSFRLTFPDRERYQSNLNFCCLLTAQRQRWSEDLGHQDEMQVPKKFPKVHWRWKSPRSKWKFAVQFFHSFLRLCSRCRLWGSLSLAEESLIWEFAWKSRRGSW